MSSRNHTFARARQKKLTDEQLRNRISDHISCCVLEGACVTANNGRPTNCSCVADVRSDETLYSNLEKCLLDYNSFDNKNRTLYIQGIVLQGHILSQRRNARDKWTPEYHPKGIIDENDSQYFFCRNGIQKLFALGYRKWKSLTEQVRLPKLKVHGNTGNKNASFQYENEVLDFLMEVAHEDGESQATRFVREMTGIGIRNEEKFGVTLPPYHTKRKLYQKYCWENGWHVRSANNGEYPKLREYPKRTNDDDMGDLALWPSGSMCYPVCSFFTFRKLWKDNFPLLKIRPPSEDICLQCHVFKNQFKFTIKRRYNQNESDDESEDDGQNMVENQKYADRRSEVEENIILQAAIHVKHARAQRALANDKIKQATYTNDHENKIHHKDKVQTIIMDYCQNLNLPHLGQDQPGDAYYFSPLSIYCFGICDAVTSHLSAFVYDESEGGKGGNNVASLLLQYVRENFVDSNLGPMMELNVIMDNCAGQNKNRMVIRMASYMLELRYFRRINLIFLVKGHTKNMCDRMFNSMKQRYHHRNIYTLEDTYKILNLDDKVTVFPTTSTNFYDWDSFFDTVYKRPKGGSIKKNHLFQYSDELLDTCTLITKVADCSTVAQSQELKKVPRGCTIEDRKQLILEATPSNLSKPGLSVLKQVHMYTKWRPLLPIELQDITCPKPTDDVVKECKSNLKKKRELKQALIYDGIEDGDYATLSKRTQSGSKKITRKRMKLLTEHEHDEDNGNMPLVSNIEYATGAGGMFTQPPPPTIAADVESLNDEPQPIVDERVYDSESDDEDGRKRSPIVDEIATPHIADDDHDNDKSINDEMAVESLIGSLNDDKQVYDDVESEGFDVDENRKSSVMNNDEEAPHNVDDNQNQNIMEDEVASQSNKKDEKTVEKPTDEVVLTADSFLGFVDKDYDNDVQSHIESLADNSLQKVQEIIIGTDKEDTTSNEVENNQVRESTPTNSMSTPVMKDSKLAAMKRVVQTKNQTRNKLKLPKTTQKQNTNKRNKPSRERSTRLLRSNVPKTALRSRQVRKKV